MHHVEMSAGELRQIERGLDRQRLGLGRMRVLPVGERALGLGACSSLRAASISAPVSQCTHAIASGPSEATWRKPSSRTSSVTDNTSRGRKSKQPQAGLHGSWPGLPVLGTHLPALLHFGRLRGVRSRHW